MILKESVPAIVNSVTLATINCVGSTAMAGAVGAGGLGSVALNYGFYSFNDLVFVYKRDHYFDHSPAYTAGRKPFVSQMSPKITTLYILYGYINKNKQKEGREEKNEKMNVTASERNDGT